jgi:ferredoxin
LYTNSVKLIYFSPTRTTKKIVEGIAAAFHGKSVKPFDLTPPTAKTEPVNELFGGLAIIGTPVYAGRIPSDAIHRLQRIKANNTLAVVVVVYGNREYEDALLELKDLAINAGFTPIAGGAFIGEHSYADEKTPIANGRPDVEDLKKAKNFGKLIRDKIGRIQTPEEISPVHVPGNFPYRERPTRSKISPITKDPLCIQCGTCVDVCPTAAITLEEKIRTDQEACIRCCACVKNCPTHARVMEHPRIKQIAERLSKNARKEPEMYI